MTSASPAEHERAHGLAVFASATFLLGMGLIAVLERVGAPNGFVQALGKRYSGSYKPKKNEKPLHAVTACKVRAWRIVATKFSATAGFARTCRWM